MYRVGNFSFNTIFIKDHAAMRMLYRDISKADLVSLITDGETIEDYPNDFPFPSKIVFKIIKNSYSIAFRMKISLLILNSLFNF